MQHTILKEWDRARVGDDIIGPALLIQAPDDRFDWESLEADEGRIYLLNLISPQLFYDRCPDHWQRPMQLTPHHGVPKNIWLGCDFGAVFADILDLWPPKRFVWMGRNEEDFELLEYMLSFVRCSNCGRRYDAPTKRCMHIQLCGDAKIVPQIDIVTGMETWAKDRVIELGAKWLSWQ